MRMDFNDAMEYSRIMQISFINISSIILSSSGYYMGE